MAHDGLDIDFSIIEGANVNKVIILCSEPPEHNSTMS